MTRCTCGCDGKLAGHYHVGWPIWAIDVCRRARRGLPAYFPTDPVGIDQGPYLRFAAARGPNDA